MNSSLLFLCCCLSNGVKMIIYCIISTYTFSLKADWILSISSCNTFRSFARTARWRITIDIFLCNHNFLFHRMRIIGYFLCVYLYILVYIYFYIYLCVHVLCLGVCLSVCLYVCVCVCLYETSISISVLAIFASLYTLLHRLIIICNLIFCSIVNIKSICILVSAVLLVSFMYFVLFFVKHLPTSLLVWRRERKKLWMGLGSVCCYNNRRNHLIWMWLSMMIEILVQTVNNFREDPHQDAACLIRQYMTKISSHQFNYNAVNERCELVFLFIIGSHFVFYVFNVENLIKLALEVKNDWFEWIWSSGLCGRKLNLH